MSFRVRCGGSAEISAGRTRNLYLLPDRLSEARSAWSWGARLSGIKVLAGVFVLAPLRPARILLCPSLVRVTSAVATDLRHIPFFAGSIASCSRRARHLLARPIHHASVHAPRNSTLRPRAASQRLVWRDQLRALVSGRRSLSWVAPHRQL